MRTITKTIKLYKFSELSDKAKERAKYDHQADLGYSWGDEMLASIKALAEHFGGRVGRYEIDWFKGSYSQMAFIMPDEVDPANIQERMSELGSYNPETLKGNGDCKLTGYCGDEDAIDGFRRAWHDGERDLNALMQAAFKSWLEAAQADCEDQYSDVVFGEMSDANDYEYTEDGEFYVAPR